MIGKALSSDFLKIRGKGLWFLAVLGPVGLIAMQALNFGLRYDYLTTRYADNLWGVLVDNIFGFVPMSLLLGITIISSLLANIEHHMSSWKQLLALPVPRTAVFGAKFALCVVLLTLSCILLGIGTIALGLLLKFGADFPVWDIARLCFYPFAASFPMLALMLWLCMTFKNQALPLTLGVVMSIFSSVSLSEWLPINWPMLGFIGPHRELFVGAGLLCGFIVLALGSLHFSRKDVN